MHCVPFASVRSVKTIRVQSLGRTTTRDKMIVGLVTAWLVLFSSLEKYESPLMNICVCTNAGLTSTIFPFPLFRFLSSFFYEWRHVPQECHKGTDSAKFAYWLNLMPMCSAFGLGMEVIHDKYIYAL